MKEKEKEKEKTVSFHFGFIVLSSFPSARHRHLHLLLPVAVALHTVSHNHTHTHTHTHRRNRVPSVFHHHRSRISSSTQLTTKQSLSYLSTIHCVIVSILLLMTTNITARQGKAGTQGPFFLFSFFYLFFSLLK